jgi:hypothetical protein
VFSDSYKPKIICWFTKTTPLNTFAVLLYDVDNTNLFGWSNKDVFDFKDESIKCYKVELLSNKNIDYANGIEMEIK